MSRLPFLGGLLAVAALGAAISWLVSRPNAGLNPQPEPPG